MLRGILGPGFLFTATAKRENIPYASAPKLGDNIKTCKRTKKSLARAVEASEKVLTRW